MGQISYFCYSTELDECGDLSDGQTHTIGKEWFLPFLLKLLSQWPRSYWDRFTGLSLVGSKATQRWKHVIRCQTC